MVGCPHYEKCDCDTKFNDKEYRAHFAARVRKLSSDANTLCNEIDGIIAEHSRRSAGEPYMGVWTRAFGHLASTFEAMSRARTHAYDIFKDIEKSEASK